MSRTRRILTVLPGGYSSRSSGFALVVVLWFSVLLSILAGAFALSVRTELEAARSIVASAQERQHAQAGLQRGIYELLNRERVGRWTHDGRPFSFEFDGQDLAIEIVDEQGKVDLNHASDELIGAALRSAGASGTTGEILVDRIVDWRDPDNLTRINGAEAADYMAADVFRRPANRPFRRISELYHVLGLNPDLAGRLAAVVTVYGFSTGLDPTVASEALLRALPGADPVEIDAFLSARSSRASGDHGEPLPLIPSLSRWSTGSMGTAFTIMVSNRTAGERRVISSITVWMDGSHERRYWILGRQQG